MQGGIWPPLPQAMLDLGPTVQACGILPRIANFVVNKRHISDQREDKGVQNELGADMNQF